MKKKTKKKCWDFSPLLSSSPESTSTLNLEIYKLEVETSSMLACMRTSRCWACIVPHPLFVVPHYKRHDCYSCSSVICENRACQLVREGSHHEIDTSLHHLKLYIELIVLADMIHLNALKPVMHPTLPYFRAVVIHILR